MCETFGFPTWASIEHPCLCCFATARNWSHYEHIEMDALPWPLVDTNDYVLACEGCEHEVVIENKMMYDRIRTVLVWDFRTSSSGFAGRAINEDLPDVGPVGLFRGDRLEPNPLLPDIADVDDIETFPCTALFWRAKAETISKHRNPLLLCLALLPETGFSRTPLPPETPL